MASLAFISTTQETSAAGRRHVGAQQKNRMGETTNCQSVKHRLCLWVQFHQRLNESGWVVACGSICYDKTNFSLIDKSYPVFLCSLANFKMFQTNFRLVKHCLSDTDIWIELVICLPSADKGNTASKQKIKNSLSLPHWNVIWCLQ